MENILSQIKEINAKTSKKDKDEIILKEKENTIKTILLKEKKDFIIENIFQFEINHKNTKNKENEDEDDNEKPNKINSKKGKQENKNNKIIVKNDEKNKKDPKKKKKIINEKINNNEIKAEENDNNENEENVEMEEDIKITNMLQNYFHNENGELNKAWVSFNELETMEKNYKSLLDKNIKITDIKEYQNNYIKLAIEPQIKKINNGRIKGNVKRRIEKIKDILDKLNKGKNK